MICASSSIFIVDLDNPEQVQSLPGFRNNVNTIIASSTRSSKDQCSFLAAAESERHVNVYNNASRTFVGSLLAESEVSSIAVSSPSVETSQGDELVAVLDMEGSVLVFPNAFEFESMPMNQNVKAREKIKAMTKKAAATIRVRRPDATKTQVPVIGASFQENHLCLAWVEGSIDVTFDKILWQGKHKGSLQLVGLVEIVRPLQKNGHGASFTNGIKNLVMSQVDDSQAVVGTGQTVNSRHTKEADEVIAISSGEEEDEEEEDEFGADGSGVEGVSTSPKLRNGIANADVMMDDVREEYAEEPSFGDLLRATKNGVVDVDTAFSDPEDQPLMVPKHQNVEAPSGISLGTVLTQSLRTNDASLLESCFHVLDLRIIRATIERLESHLATTLLQKLAERFYSRPGRAGSLMVWIQWTIVAHGGYIVNQPGVLKQLSSLHQAVSERAGSLPSLLTLKGKLDMLEAQLNIRKGMQRQLAQGRLDKDEEEAAVVYVEGQPDDLVEKIGDEGQDQLEDEVRDLGGGEGEDELFTDQDAADEDEGSSEEGMSDSGGRFVDDMASEDDGVSDDIVSSEEIDHDSLSSIEQDDQSDHEQEVSVSKRQKESVLGLSNNSV
ncbi:Small subunit (SSU) processome component [Bachmanniomyces sp. S44760]|nr:Small subunit (SSU) processome component [Bachmanniomyces sp. S44760]